MLIQSATVRFHGDRAVRQAGSGGSDARGSSPERELRRVWPVLDHDPTGRVVGAHVKAPPVFLDTD